MSAQMAEDIQDAAVYVVEADPAIRHEISVALFGMPWPVYSYDSPRALMDDLTGSAWGCVIANVELVDMSIVEFLKSLEPDAHRVELILLSRDIEIPEAVAAMRAGVHDVLQLPIIERALRRQVRAAIAKLNLCFMTN